MSSISLISSSFHLLFYCITLVFILFSLSLAYHLFTFGSTKSASTLTMAIFLIVSMPLFITMAVALRMI